MIRITIDLCPLGDESNPTRLATAKIWNNARGTKSKGSYTYVLRDKAGREWKKGNVTGFPRLRLLAYDLLYRVLKDAVGDRNDV